MNREHTCFIRLLLSYTSRKQLFSESKIVEIFHFIIVHKLKTEAKISQTIKNVKYVIIITKDKMKFG